MTVLTELRQNTQRQREEHEVEMAAAQPGFFLFTFETGEGSIMIVGMGPGNAQAGWHQENPPYPAWDVGDKAQAWTQAQLAPLAQEREDLAGQLTSLKQQVQPGMC